MIRHPKRMKTKITLSEHLIVLHWEFFVERSFHGLMQQNHWVHRSLDKGKICIGDMNKYISFLKRF